jgi:hypothetical protein
MEPFFDPTDKPAFEEGGAGLIATMEGYLKFTLMLANGGTWNGKRLLGRQTVSWMTADHLGSIPGFPAAGRGSLASASRSARSRVRPHWQDLSGSTPGRATPARSSGSIPSKR